VQQIPPTLQLAACLLLPQVQPEGPYLLGGHSYGGLVAMEVAAVLEAWGHDVGLVIIMDTPRPEQVRG
jgi:thioesterase domain-containing protein